MPQTFSQERIKSLLSPPARLLWIDHPNRNRVVSVVHPEVRNPCHIGQRCPNCPLIILQLDYRQRALVHIKQEVQRVAAADLPEAAVL